LLLDHGATVVRGASARIGDFAEMVDRNPMLYVGFAVSATAAISPMRSQHWAPRLGADIDQWREKEMAMSQMTTKGELAFRVNDGLTVSLFWTRVGDMLTLEVYDDRRDEFHECGVPRSRALDAFRHPFAYITGTGTAVSVQPCAA
jgi:hypothetical protein